MPATGPVVEFAVDDDTWARPSRDRLRRSNGPAPQHGRRRGRGEDPPARAGTFHELDGRQSPFDWRHGGPSLKALPRAGPKEHQGAGATPQSGPAGCPGLAFRLDRKAPNRRPDPRVIDLCVHESWVSRIPRKYLLRAFVLRYPALSLFLLAVVLGTAPMIPVAMGIVPDGFVQLGALSASAAGFLLAALESGIQGARDLAGRVLRWRAGLRWWLAALLVPAGSALAAAHAAAAVDGVRVAIDAGTLGSLLPAFLFLFVFAGLGEEFGWRGYAVPRVQARHGALAASLIIGAFHALWHVPLFFIEGVGQHAIAQQIGLVPSMLGYSMLVLALAVQATWIFNNTAGSVLLVATYHGAANASAVLVDPTSGRMTGIYAYTLVTVAVSVLVVAVFGSARLSRRPEGGGRLSHGESIDGIN